MEALQKSDYLIFSVFLTYLKVYRKKKSEKLKSKVEKLREKERVDEILLKEDKSKEAGSSSGSGSGRNSPSVGDNGGNKTDAERRFEEIQKRRVRLSFFLSFFERN